MTENKVSIIICINDINFKTCTDAEDHETDVIKLFLERIDQYINRYQTSGLMITDRPSGNRASEDNFLFNCIKTIEEGTDYVKPDNFAHSVLSTPSKFSRMIQCSDVITGSITSLVGGESKYSPKLFKKLKPLLHHGLQTEGYGLKIHPEYKYDNLYHWLLGEEYKIHAGSVIEYPINDKPYAINPYTWSIE